MSAPVSDDAGAQCLLGSSSFVAREPVVDALSFRRAGPPGSRGHVGSGQGYHLDIPTNFIYIDSDLE